MSTFIPSLLELTDASNITSGTLPTGRLTGTYNISITGTSAGAPPIGSAGGILNGAYPSPSLNINSTNLQITANILDTIQDISTTSSPLFSALTLTNSGEAVNFVSQTVTVISSGSQTNLNQNSAQLQLLTGTLNQTFKLPNGTTLTPGYTYYFNNNSTGILTVNDSSNNLIVNVPSGGLVRVNLTSTSGAAGIWDYHWLAPTNVSWGSASFTYPGDTQFGSSLLGPSQTRAGIYKSYITGLDSSSTASPSQAFYTAIDQYPLLHTFPFTHNNVSLNFDAYFDGNWRSSYSGSNYQIYKASNQLQFNYSSGVAAGSMITWTTGMTMDTTGKIKISSLTASSLVATDASKNLTSTVSSLSPTFAGLSLSGTGTVNGSITTTTIGSANQALWTLQRGDQTNGDAVVIYKTGATSVWQIGLQSGSANFFIKDLVNNSVLFGITPGVSGIIQFGGGLFANSDVTANFGNLIVNTVGYGIKVKQGTNATSGTGAVLVGGTVTVNTTAVATGDTIFLSCTAAGGTQGIPRISAIVNGTSFTITSSQALDTSTYSWLIIKAA